MNKIACIGVINLITSVYKYIESCISISLFLLFFLPVSAFGTSSNQEELLTSNLETIGTKLELDFIGGYRLEAGTFGTSRFAFSPGAFAVSDDDKQVFVSGHTHHFSVGAFLLPSHPKKGHIGNYPIAKNFQPFVPISPPFKSTETANRITGIEILGDQLLVMVDEYYDADNNNKEHLVVFDNLSDLKRASQVGYFQIAGKSHAAGWMSKIPQPLADKLDALYLAGSASNLPINIRLSLGPTFFTWFPYFLENIDPTEGRIETEALLDYSLHEPLHEDRYNKSGNNSIWTEVSTSVYGFISPDQKYYIVLGSSGGHRSKIGYKITQDSGNLCGGPCAYSNQDYYNHYWIYSIEDILASKQKLISPSKIRPVEYGKLDIGNHKHLLIGADYNSTSNRLYLMLELMDTTQDHVERQPVIVVYEVS